MQPRAECCVSNVDAEARALLTESDVDAVESYCLDRCGECYEGPFLVVDGTVVRGKSYEAVLGEVTEDR